MVRQNHNFCSCRLTYINTCIYINHLYIKEQLGSVVRIHRKANSSLWYELWFGSLHVIYAVYHIQVGKRFKGRTNGYLRTVLRARIWNAWLCGKSPNTKNI
jgi:hypothetical protein